MQFVRCVIFFAETNFSLFGGPIMHSVVKRLGKRSGGRERMEPLTGLSYQKKYGESGCPEVQRKRLPSTVLKKAARLRLTVIVAPLM